MEYWRPVLNADGDVMINGNNIVLQHINTKEIGYVDNNDENLRSLSIINDDMDTEENASHILSDEECNGNSDNKVKWTHKLTKLLIVKRLGREQLFNRPKCKKLKLWTDIAKEINNETKGANPSLTASICDNKFRNLLKTYEINKKKQKSSGESAITWDYFSDFDEVLGCKASIEPPENNLFDTLDAGTNTYTDSEHVSTPLNEESQPGPSNEREPVRMKKKSTMKYQEYLYIKNKRAEAKEEFDREKWNEEKLLRREETAAILKLAEGLSKKAE